MSPLKILPVVSTLVLQAALAAEPSTPVPFPEDYRAWYHIKSMVIQPGHTLENPFGGIHHVYANPKALEGLRTGSYSDGAILVFDLLNFTEADHAITEGPRKLVGVMQRDSARYAATGGWGYEGFAGDSRTERLVKDGGQGCHGCHAAKKSSDYVFSQLRDR